MCLVCVSAGVIVACQTVQVVNFSAPEEECARDTDIDLLADLLPEYEDAERAIPLEEAMNRVIFSVGYCQEAQKLLR